MENEFQNQEPQMEPSQDETNQSGLLPDGELDHEGAMAKADLFKLGKYSYKLFKKLEDDTQLESWVQAKITKAADYLASVYHYLEFEMKFNDYAHKLDNSDMLSEGQKAEMKNKLIEAKGKIKELKIAEAKKGGMVLKGHPYHYKSDDELKYIQKDAHEAAHAMRDHDPKAEAKYLDQVNDASSVLYHRKNGGKQLTKPKHELDEAKKTNKTNKTNKDPVAKNLNKFNVPKVEPNKKKESKNKGPDADLGESQLNELGHDKINSYVGHALDDYTDAISSGNLEKMNKRRKGLDRVTGGHPNDAESLNNLTTKTAAIATARKRDIPKYQKDIETDKKRILNRSMVKHTMKSPVGVAGDLYETGLSKAKKSAVVKDAKAGKNFDKVSKKAGSGEKGTAAAMWKKIKEGVELNEMPLDPQTDAGVSRTVPPYFVDMSSGTPMVKVDATHTIAIEQKTAALDNIEAVEEKLNKQGFVVAKVQVNNQTFSVAMSGEKCYAGPNTYQAIIAAGAQKATPEKTDLNESVELNRMKEFLTRLNG